MTLGKRLAQLGVFGLFILAVGVFSDSPLYHRLQPDQALVRLAFSHFGQPIHECHRLTQEELNALAPNMRKAVDCPRERLPLRVEFFLDRQPIFQASIAASGLWEDGDAAVYQKFLVSAGVHQLLIRMRDSARSEGFDYQLDERVSVNAMRNLVIGFDPGRKQFVIH
jgi:hypothetical protein